jgi:S-adenosyl-L-methionine hydrolase (adenosine-forming)
MGSPPFTISLLTDFGDQDEYVGVMKGVILSRAPHAVIVDLCHQIVPHDIRQATALIAASYHYFPEGALHVMVVDPGVGGTRGIVFAQASTCGFLCPDNGLLTGMIAQGILHKAWRVTNRDLFSPTVSETFHGRDIIAPVAGFLASGNRPETLGPRQPIGDLLCLEGSPARLEQDGSLWGTVVTVDRFGNVVTNIGRDLLTSSWEGDLKQSLMIAIASHQTIPLVSSYSAVPIGGLLATIGSRNTLEIAVNQGNAGMILGVVPGAQIRISRQT